MNKTLPICIIGLLSFYLSTALAQTDTSKYDLGRVQMDKNLTQSVTIKAADLERMPFSNLSEAINAWLYGAYGGPSAYVPVIDGVVMMDVNALSIYDIDEITLVQNASATLNGAAPQQLLLLIKTKHNHDGKKYGIEAAGQANVVQLHHQDNSSYTGGGSTRFYHQYYLSGYVNTSKINAGASADYQRDVIPEPSTGQLNNGAIVTNNVGPALNRYRFNGYFDANLGKSVLSISTGYVPQTEDASGTSGMSYLTSTAAEKLKENLFYSNVSLKSSFWGLRNTLTGSFERYHYLNDQDTTTQYGVANTGITINDSKEIWDRDNSYAIKDNLSYVYQKGRWKIEPGVNFMYRYYHSDEEDTSSSKSINRVSTEYSLIKWEQKITTITPALNISYRGVFALEGGFEIMKLSSNYNYFGPLNHHTFQKPYPFVSAMWHVLSTTDNEESAFGVSVFGSYAKAPSYQTDTYNQGSSITSMNVLGDFSATSLNLNTVNVNNNPYAAYNQWQAGAKIDLSHGVIFSYTYGLHQFSNIISIPYYLISNGGVSPFFMYYNVNNKLITHRFELDMKWVKTDKLSWEANLNASYIQTSTALPSSSGNNTTLPYPFITSNPIKNHYLTGGLVNRVNFKEIFAGADILYISHVANPYSGSIVPQYYSAFNLENLYLGKQYKFHAHPVEVFINMRSILETRSPVLLDTRKYYGLGFKLGI